MSCGRCNWRGRYKGRWAQKWHDLVPLMQRSECVVKWRGSQNTGKWNQQGRVWLNLQVAMCSGIRTDLGAGIRSSVHISLQGGIYCQTLTCLTLGPAASLSWSLKSWDGAVSHLWVQLAAYLHSLSPHLHSLSLLLLGFSTFLVHLAENMATDHLWAFACCRNPKRNCQSQVKMSRVTWLDSGAQCKINS